MITDQARRVHDAAFQAGLLVDDLQFRDWSGHPPRREELSLVLLAARSLDDATLELGATAPRAELPVSGAVSGLAAGVAASVAGLLLVPDPGNPLTLAAVLTTGTIIMALVHLAVLGLYARSARRCAEPGEDLAEAYAELRGQVSALVGEEESGENRQELLWWLVTAGEFLEMADEVRELSSSRSSPGEPAGRRTRRRS